MNDFLIHEHGRLQLCYQRIGQGEKVYLAFHGFGLDSSLFRRFFDQDSKDYTVYAFDLFYHGKSGTTLDQPQPIEHLTPVEWQAFVNHFIQSLEIKSVDIIGYSLGGRMALSLAESLKNRIDHFHLIAPDGIVLSPWYRFAVDTAVGRKLFRSIPYLRRPLGVFGALLWKLKMLDEKLYRIALENTADSSRSEQLYNTWMFLRQIRPSLARVAQVFELESMGLTVHLGEYDKVIPVDKVLKWRLLEDYPAYARVYRTGHVSLLDPALEHVLSETN